MAQKTSWNGATLTESDINTYLMGEGGAWTSWTPTVTQSASVTVTNTHSRYARYGRTIHATTLLTVTGSGTASNDILISLPVTAAAAYGAAAIVMGVGHVIDSSASLSYHGPAVSFNTTTCRIKAASAASSTGYLGGTTFTAGLASGDNLLFTITYEAAS
jgi:hypothetical protein